MCPRDLSFDEATIGLSVGGAKDINNFRDRIEKHMIPSINSITYNGLLYEYYFDTKSKRHRNHTRDNTDIEEKTENETDLFYPSYCYGKIRGFNDDYTRNETKWEYYMTLGLNSNIKQSKFKRKLLNLVIVLDHSGSMGWGFQNDGFKSDLNKNKMKIANKAVIELIKHLNDNDRFGMVIFDHEVEVIQKLQFMNNINHQELKNKILNIKENGGTNFEIGYNKAIQLYQQLNTMNDRLYENRIIILTDAQPNIGDTNSKFIIEDGIKICRKRCHTTYIHYR